MATGKVTKRTVDALKPGATNAFVWDDEVRGFGLKVTPAGARSYLFQYRMGGRGTPTRRYTIGKHGSLTPDQAREIAKALARQVAEGIDPLEAQRLEAAAAETAARRAVDLAFETMAERWLAEVVTHKWPASIAFASSILRLHVTPALRGRSIDAISREDLVAVLDAIPASRLALRRNVYAVTRPLFRWAVGRGIDRSPLDGFDDAPSGPPSRDRVLTDAELRLAWIAAGDLGPPFGPFYRLLLGTGARREEIAGLDWRELNRAASEWTLPAERSKNGQPNVVHLAAAMIAELDALAGCADVDEGDRKWPRRGLVLTTTGKTPISGYSRAKARLDAAMMKVATDEAEAAGEDPEAVELQPWRVHDLRRTVATGLQRLGVRFEVTEAVLNHASGRSRSGVAAVYQRHGWTEEKRAALELWGQHVTLAAAGLDIKTAGQIIAGIARAMLAPPTGSNVVPLRRRRT